MQTYPHCPICRAYHKSASTIASIHFRWVFTIKDSKSDYVVASRVHKRPYISIHSKVVLFCASCGIYYIGDDYRQSTYDLPEFTKHAALSSNIDAEHLMVKIQRLKSASFDTIDWVWRESYLLDKPVLKLSTEYTSRFRPETFMAFVDPSNVHIDDEECKEDLLRLLYSQCVKGLQNQGFSRYFSPDEREESLRAGAIIRLFTGANEWDFNEEDDRKLLKPEVWAWV